MRNVRYWHLADSSTLPIDVRFWGQSGHALAAEMSAFDPKRTFGWTWVQLDPPSTVWEIRRSIVLFVGEARHEEGSLLCWP